VKNIDDECIVYNLLHLCFTCRQPTRAHHFPIQRSKRDEKVGVEERNVSNTTLTSSIKTLSQRGLFGFGVATLESSCDFIFFEDSDDTLRADDERPASAKLIGPVGFPDFFSLCSCVGRFISGMVGIIVGIFLFEKLCEYD
jgi:hypothetical protein